MTVLVVDDIPSARKILQSFLRNLGFEDVVQARSVSEALEQFAARDFDLVVSDYNLGDSNGLELQEQLRQRGKFPHFILVTGDHNLLEGGQRKFGKTLGLLKKPFSLDDLRQKILEVLSTAVG